MISSRKEVNMTMYWQIIKYVTIVCVIIGVVKDFFD
jgi:hypothetical protein